MTSRENAADRAHVAESEAARLAHDDAALALDKLLTMARDAGFKAATEQARGKGILELLREAGDDAVLITRQKMKEEIDAEVAAAYQAAAAVCYLESDAEVAQVDYEGGTAASIEVVRHLARASAARSLARLLGDSILALTPASARAALHARLEDARDRAVGDARAAFDAVRATIRAEAREEGRVEESHTLDKHHAYVDRIKAEARAEGAAEAERGIRAALVDWCDDDEDVFDAIDHVSEAADAGDEAVAKLARTTAPFRGSTTEFLRRELGAEAFDALWGPHLERVGDAIDLLRARAHADGFEEARRAARRESCDRARRGAPPMPSLPGVAPRWVVRGLFRCAESREQDEGAAGGSGLWDDESRRAVEWMRANVADHAGNMPASDAPGTPAEPAEKEPSR